MNACLEKTYILNNPPCISEVIAGDAVAINLDTGSYYSMVGVAGQVWECLSQGYSIRKIIDAIKIEGGEASMLESKLSTFIASLCTEGLLKEVDFANEERLAVIQVNVEELDLNFKVYTDMQELLSLDPVHDADETMGWPKAKETV